MLTGTLARLVKPAQLIEELRSGRATQLWRELCAAHEPDLVNFLPSAIDRLNLRLARVDLPQALRRAADFDFRPQLVSEFPNLERSLLDLGAAAPRVVWIAGDTSVLNLDSLGMVGSRQCSSYGISVVRGVLERLTDSHSVVSGGAIGIDSAAHRIALENGIPTVSYLAGGPDRLYPSLNLPLFESIKRAGGALVAECAPGTPPGRWRFLQRNRLIAAQSRVLLVAECGYRSGARNTARIAGELGRTVYAAPGQLTSSASAGCNLMISYGTAQCLTDFDEPVDALTGAEPRNKAPRWRPANEQRVLDELETTGQSLIDIANRAGLSIREASKTLEALTERGEARKRGEAWVRGDSNQFA